MPCPIRAFHLNKHTLLDIDEPQDHVVRYTLTLTGYPDEQDDEPILALAQVLCLPYAVHSDMSFGELLDLCDAHSSELAEVTAHLQEDRSMTNWMDLEADVRDVVYLSRLVVSPHCRGQGVGTRMMQLILSDISHYPYLLVSATPCELVNTDIERDNNDAPEILRSVEDLDRLSFDRDNLAEQARLRDWYARFGFSLIDPLHDSALMALSID